VISTESHVPSGEITKRVARGSYIRPAMMHVRRRHELLKASDDYTLLISISNHQNTLSKKKFKTQKRNARTYGDDPDEMADRVERENTDCMPKQQEKKHLAAVLSLSVIE
jgi:hypothetical protein